MIISPSLCLVTFFAYWAHIKMLLFSMGFHCNIFHSNTLGRLAEVRVAHKSLMGVYKMRYLVVKALKVRNDFHFVIMLPKRRLCLS